MNSKVFEKVRDFICDNNGWLKEEEISANSNLIDLGVDSIQMMMLLVCIENDFDIVIEDGVLEQELFSTIESFVDYIEVVINESNMDK